jgi:hypothetical protein
MKRNEVWLRAYVAARRHHSAADSIDEADFALAAHDERFDPTVGEAENKRRFAARPKDGK